MIQREGGDEFAVLCDRCSWEDFFYGDFYEVVEEIKANGWKISKKGGEWLHTCPDCAYGTARVKK